MTCTCPEALSCFTCEERDTCVMFEHTEDIDWLEV